MAERGAMRMHLPTTNAAKVVPNFNPYLDAYQNPHPNQDANAEQIFATTNQDLIQWQTRPTLPSEYENTLADALKQIFTQRIYDLPDIVATLNRENVRTPSDKTWTEANFQNTFRELGKLAFR